MASVCKRKGTGKTRELVLKEKKKKRLRLKEAEEEEEEEEEVEVESEDEVEEEDEEEKAAPPSSFSFANVRELLSTGLLEGVPVTYRNSSRNALAADKFERHARATSSHANNHIFLGNGKALHEVVKQLNASPPGSLYKEIKDATGCHIDFELYKAWTIKEANKYKKTQECTQASSQTNNVLNQCQLEYRTDVEPSPPDLLKQLDLASRFCQKGPQSAHQVAPKAPIDFTFGTNLAAKLKDLPESVPASCKRNYQFPRKKRGTINRVASRQPNSTSSIIYHSNINALQDLGERIQSEEDKANYQQTEEKEGLEDGSRTKPNKSEENGKNLNMNMKGGNLSDVRSLLSTGLLEGFPVTYKKGKVEIRGFIRNLGYQCGCSSCNYTKVLCALDFEKHAGVASKNQNDHIFLDSGISLYKLVKKLKARCMEPIAEEIENISCFPPNMKCLEKGKDISKNVERIQENLADFIVCQSEGFSEPAMLGNVHPTPNSTVHLSTSKPALECCDHPASSVTTSPSALEPTAKDKIHLSSDVSVTPGYLMPTRESFADPTASMTMKPHTMPATEGSAIVTPYVNVNPNSLERDTEDSPEPNFATACCFKQEGNEGRTHQSSPPTETMNMNYSKPAVEHSFLEPTIVASAHPTPTSTVSLSYSELATEYSDHSVSSVTPSPSALELAKKENIHLSLAVSLSSGSLKPARESFTDPTAIINVEPCKVLATKGSADVAACVIQEYNNSQHSNEGRTHQRSSVGSKSNRSEIEGSTCYAEIATTEFKLSAKETSHVISSLTRNLSTLELATKGYMRTSLLSSGKESPETNVAAECNLLQQGNKGEAHQSSRIDLTPSSSETATEGSIYCVQVSAIEPNSSLPSAKEITRKISSLTENLSTLELATKGDMKHSSFGSGAEGNANLVPCAILNNSSSDPLGEDDKVAVPINSVKPNFQRQTNDKSHILLSNVVVNSSFMGQATISHNDLAPKINDNLISQMPSLKQRLCPATYSLTQVSFNKQLPKLSTMGSQSELKNLMSTTAALQGLPYFSKSNVKQAQSKLTAYSRPKKRDNDLHQLIFKENGIPDGSKLSYCIKGEVVKRGYKIGNCIKCNCCKKEMSPSQFEAHAGYSRRRKPYHNIYTSDGTSLHDVSISLSKHETSPENSTMVQFDDRHQAKSVHCSGCAKSFLADSLELPYAPDGEWFCPHYKDNFRSRDTSESKRAGIAGSTKLRVRRLLQAQTDELLCCTLCEDKNYSLDIFSEKTEIFCEQCEREYHIGCLKRHRICDLKEVPLECRWFCCQECNSIHDTLDKLVMKNSGDSSLFGILKEKALERSSTNNLEADMQWQILSGKSSVKKLLMQALAVFSDAFDPIVERGCDLIPAMIYAEDAGGKLFGGMYCPVITVKSMIVSAGIVRIFGQRVAELPLIATLQEYQKKGYFRTLLLLIEELLCYLNIEYLIVPANKDAQSFWTEKLGFVKLTDERLEKYLKDYPLLMFQNTTMLEKALRHSFPN